MAREPRANPDEYLHECVTTAFVARMFNCTKVNIQAACKSGAMSPPALFVTEKGHRFFDRAQVLRAATDVTVNKPKKRAKLPNGYRPHPVLPISE